MNGTPPQGLPGEFDASHVNDIWGALDDVRTQTRGWVSVLAYGADRTGATSSTTAVAAAYAATAPSATHQGAAIYFPAGKYKFNLTIARSGVRIIGSGRARVADTTPVGGSIFVPADLTKPIIQIGDGTSTVEKVTVEHFSMLGDGTFTTQGTATSDGIVLNGVYNTLISDFEIGFMGGRSAYLTSGTKATSYNHFVNGEFINYSRYGVLVDYGASWTTANYFDHVNFSPAQLGALAGDYGIRLEGTSVYLSNSWVQALDGHAHIYLLKDAGGHAPKLNLTNTFVDTGGNAAWTVMDINIGGPHQLLTMYVSGSAYGLDGKIRWDDGTIIAGDGSNQSAPPMRLLNPKIQQKLYFDLWQNSLGTEFNDASTPPILLQGKERTTGGTTPILEMTGAHFRIPGTFGQALEFAATSGSLWPNATTKRLHYLPTSAYPGNDIDGAPFTPLLKTLTYAATMTPVADQGSWFAITATNATAFTVNAPTINAFSAANFSGYRITITIKNTSGGALGVATFAATYKMAAWTQPATGFNRSIDFIYDGTNWIEASRTPADVPN